MFLINIQICIGLAMEGILAAEGAWISLVSLSVGLCACVCCLSVYVLSEKIKGNCK